MFATTDTDIAADTTADTAVAVTKPLTLGLYHMLSPDITSTLSTKLPDTVATKPLNLGLYGIWHALTRHTTSTPPYHCHHFRTITTTATCSRISISPLALSLQNNHHCHTITTTNLTQYLPPLLTPKPLTFGLYHMLSPVTPLALPPHHWHNDTTTNPTQCLTLLPLLPPLLTCCN